MIDEAATDDNSLPTANGSWAAGGISTQEIEYGNVYGGITDHAGEA